MPTVPQARPQVSRTAMPTPGISSSATPEAFGAGLGKAVTGVAGDVIEFERQRADDMAHMVALNDLKRFSNALLYDANNGVLNKKGKDAVDAPNFAMDAFDKRAGEIESALYDERQRNAFRKSAYMLRADTDLTVQRHTANEIKQYDLNEMNSFMANSKASIAGSVSTGNMERVGFEISSQETEIMKFAARNGMGPEWVRASIEKARTETHLAVIEILSSSQQDKLAQTYFNAKKDEIVGAEAQVRANTLVQTGYVAAQSRREADAIMASPFNRSGKYDEARAIEDTKVRDATIARLDAEFARQDRLELERKREVSQVSVEMIEAGTSLDDLPVSVLAELGVSERTSLRAYERMIAKGDGVGTDWKVYYDLMDKASSEDESKRRAFAKTNIYAMRHKLGDTEFKELVRLQGSVRAGNEKDVMNEEDMVGYRTNKQIVDDALMGSGIDSTPKLGSKDAERVAKFRRIVDEQIVQFKATNGRKPNYEEVEGIVDTLLVKGKVPGTGILVDDTKFAFELEDEEELAITIKDIPPRDMKLIRESLTRNGVTSITNDKIVAMFNTRLRLMRNAK